MNNNTFCPFVNGECRSDCMFNIGHLVAVDRGTSKCLIAVKLSGINEYQQDQLYSQLKTFSRKSISYFHIEND